MRPFLALSIVTLLGASAAAQPLGVTAELERPMAATGGDDPTASATEIDAQNRANTTDTLDDLLLEAPGARPIRSGAYGSASSLALRGSDPNQVEVIFGDLPITTADGSPFDLSTVPIFVLDRIEVYRGGAPTWFGAGGIGGLLRLVPLGDRQSARQGPLITGSLGAGSFGFTTARVASHVDGPDVRFSSGVSFTRSDGDFPIRDDNRTAFDVSDDFDRPRRNAAIDEGAGIGSLSARVDDSRFSVFGFGLTRAGGIPSAGQTPTRHTYRNETQLLGAVGWTLTDRGRPEASADWRVQVAASSGYRRRRVTDRFGEIGLAPRITDDESSRSVVRMAASGRIAEVVELTGVGIYARDELAPDDALARRAPDASSRDAGRWAVEGRLFGRVDDVRLELRGSARLALTEARLSELAPDRLGETTSSFIVAPTFRIGVGIEPTPGVTIASSFSSATRAPTMLELFGDRVFLLGDTRLQSERAESVDLSLALVGREGPVTGQLEARGFATFSSDLIRYRRNNQFQVIPENIASAVLVGGELGIRGSVTRHLSVNGALNVLETQAAHFGQNRRLPLRSPLTAFVRVEAHAFEIGPIVRASLWADASYVGESFWDPANTLRIPDFVRFGLGARFSLYGGHAGLSFSVRDLFDARGSDLLGFPLPGRTFALAFSLTSD